MSAPIGNPPVSPEVVFATPPNTPRSANPKCVPETPKGKVYVSRWIPPGDQPSSPFRILESSPIPCEVVDAALSEARNSSGSPSSFESNSSLIKAGQTGMTAVQAYRAAQAALAASQAGHMDCLGRREEVFIEEIRRQRLSPTSEIELMHGIRMRPLELEMLFLGLSPESPDLGINSMVASLRSPENWKSALELTGGDSVVIRDLIDETPDSRSTEVQVNNILNLFCHFIPEVKKLDLSHLGLITLPKSLAPFAHIEELDLSHNQLETLTCSGESINEQNVLVPKFYKTVNHLNASHNLITGLDDSRLHLFPRMDRLISLNLSDNRINRPLTFEGMPSLELLDFHNNPIFDQCRLSGSTFHQLYTACPELKRLIVKNLPLNTLVEAFPGYRLFALNEGEAAVTLAKVKVPSFLLEISQYGLKIQDKSKPQGSSCPDSTLRFEERRPPSADFRPRSPGANLPSGTLKWPRRSSRYHMGDSVEEYLKQVALQRQAEGKREFWGKSKA